MTRSEKRGGTGARCLSKVSAQDRFFPDLGARCFVAGTLSCSLCSAGTFSSSIGKKQTETFIVKILLTVYSAVFIFRIVCVYRANVQYYAYIQEPPLVYFAWRVRTHPVKVMPD